MKWFKHDTDASNDPKIKKLKKKFGMVGYGTYFNLLELIARKMENNVKEFGFLPVDWDDESLELELGLDTNTVRTMFDYMFEIGLFEKKQGRLYNSKIQSRCDDYTSRLLRKDEYRAKISNVSEQSTNSVRTKSDKVRLDKNRIDKIRTEEKRKENKIIPSEQSSQETQKIMEIFYKINPTINWGNKTSRKAAADLIKQFGFEGTVQMAEQIVSVFGKPFVPVATTPYQMKEKLAQFKAYFDGEKNKNESRKGVEI